MSVISLEGIKVYAFHGVLEEERKIGALYRVDIRIETDVIKAAQEDDIFQTIDYTLVYDIVREEMKLSSKLIENVAYRILKKITSTFTKALHTQVKISKINPPIHGDIENVSIALESIRE